MTRRRRLFRRCIPQAQNMFTEMYVHHSPNTYVRIPKNEYVRTYTTLASNEYPVVVARGWHAWSVAWAWLARTMCVCGVSGCLRTHHTAYTLRVCTPGAAHLVYIGIVRFTAQYHITSPRRHADPPPLVDEPLSDARQTTTRTHTAVHAVLGGR